MACSYDPSKRGRKNWTPLVNYNPDASTVIPPSERQPPPPSPAAPLDICIDVEVSDTFNRDIDDLLLLVLAAGDARFRIRCVTVVPGTYTQINMVRYILKELAGHDDGDISIGATDWPHFSAGSTHSELTPAARALGAEQYLSDEYYVQYIRPADVVLAEAFAAAAERGKGVTVFTGAAKTNLAAGLRLYDQTERSKETPAPVRCWLAQGGYASKSAVVGSAVRAAPPSDSSSPTSGSARDRDEFCPSFNITQDLPATRYALSRVEGYSSESPLIESALFVSSKLHAEGNVMAPEWIDRASSVAPSHLDTPARRATLEAFRRIAPHPGKKLHDLALIAAALTPSVLDWTGVVKFVSVAPETGRWPLWGTVAQQPPCCGIVAGRQTGVRVSYWLRAKEYIRTVLPTAADFVGSEVEVTPHAETRPVKKVKKNRLQ